LLIYVKLNKIVQKEKSSNLQMVSENLKLTFKLFTGYYSSLALPFKYCNASYFWLQRFCIKTIVQADRSEFAAKR